MINMVTKPGKIMAIMRMQPMENMTPMVTVITRTVLDTVRATILEIEVTDMRNIMPMIKRLPVNTTQIVIIIMEVNMVCTIIMAILHQIHTLTPATISMDKRAVMETTDMESAAAI